MFLNWIWIRIKKAAGSGSGSALRKTATVCISGSAKNECGFTALLKSAVSRDLHTVGTGT